MNLPRSPVVVFITLSPILTLTGALVNGILSSSTKLPNIVIGSVTAGNWLLAFRLIIFVPTLSASNAFVTFVGAILSVSGMLTVTLFVPTYGVTGTENLPFSSVFVVTGWPFTNTVTG